MAKWRFQIDYPKRENVKEQMEALKKVVIKALFSASGFAELSGEHGWILGSKDRYVRLHENPDFIEIAGILWDPVDILRFASKLKVTENQLKMKPLY